MGQARRPKPARLSAKLRLIRASLGLSQNEMIARLGLAGEMNQSNISAFERGAREPALQTLLAYARAAGVCMDVLVDDESDLPRTLPSIPKHEDEGRKTHSRRR